MADPLSVASGIAGLLSLAGAAFRSVHQYVRAVKDSKGFVIALSKELQSLSSVIQGVKVLAEAFEQDQTAPSVILRLEHISACRNILDMILKETNGIRGATDNKRSFSSRVESLRWPFRKSKTEELISELSRHKATLTLACDAASLSALVDCLGKISESGLQLSKIHEGVENLQILPQIQMDAQRERVLNFFMPIDQSPSLQTTWKLRHPGTGIWLTESLRFRTWISDAGSKIWLSGMPGAGKTVLAGAAIREALQEAATFPRVGVAYFFCDYKNRETWNTINILGAITVQLARQNESAFHKLQKYHGKIRPHLGLQQSPDADDLCEVIMDESEDFDRLLVVVDGLDECGDNTEHVSKVLSNLAQDVPNMSLAFFSRDDEGIQNSLQEQFDQITIAARSEDISLYVGVELEKRIEQGQLRIRDMTLKDEILSRLTSGAEGMFRWVACQLDALGECVTDADRRAALYELPRTLPQTYERILDRVNRKRPSVRRLVRLSLQFIALKDRALRLPIVQLCQAVSIPEEPGADWDESLIVKEQEISRACSSLLHKTADGKYFEFAHFSVREYLEGSSLLEKPDLRPYHISESSIRDAVACQCLRFIQLKKFDHKPCRRRNKKCGICTKRDKLYNLYDFAASSWPMLVHFIQKSGSKSSKDLLDLQKSILHPKKSNSYSNWVIQLCKSLGSTPTYPVDDKHSSLNPGVSTLHVAAALDLTEVGSWLLGLDIPMTFHVQVGSVLEFSVAGVVALDETIKGHPTTMGDYYIVHPGSSLAYQLSSRGETLSTPSVAFKDRKLMQLACDSVVSRRDFSSLRLLLSYGWQLCSEDLSIVSHCWQTDFIPQEQEIEDNFLDFVKYLDSVAIHKTQEGHELCAMTWDMAIRDGRSFVADTSLLPSSITLSEEALLASAIQSIKDDNVELLNACEQDARFNLQEVENESGYYALHIAAQNKSWKVLDYMINTGCDLEKPNTAGWTFLHVLAYEKIHPAELESLESILKRPGHEIQKLMSALNHKGQTALDVAFKGKDRKKPTSLLRYYPKYLGCCHSESCIWDQAACADSIEIVQTLADIQFPCHPRCAGGRPFRLLSHSTDLQRFELLLAMHPNSLDNPRNGTLALESCLRRWERYAPTLDAVEATVIQALLRHSEPLSPTSPEAIEFCCRLVHLESYASNLDHKLELLQVFLENGIDVHHESHGKAILETAWHTFTRRADVGFRQTFHILKVIFDRVDKKKINGLDASGESMLHKICTSTTRDADCLITKLAERGADVNIFRGQSPYDTPLVASLDAAADESISSAQTLLKLGADPALAKLDGCDAAQMASLRGLDDFLHDLFLHLTNTSTAFDWGRRCSLFDEWDGSGRIFQGLNSLHVASLNGQKDCFDFFLDHDLIKDVHATSEEGFGCLHFAAFDEGAQMIDHLIDLGLDINQPATDGSTPLHIAVRMKRRLGVEKLMSRGASMKKDVLGMTPVMYARKLGLDGVIEILAKYDMPHAEAENPTILAQDARNRYWRKALEEAILAADVQLCARIMGEGCPVDISLPRCGGCSPLLLSIDRSFHGDLELVRLFLENSASVCKQSCSRSGSVPAVIKALEHHHLNCFLPRMLDLCLQECSESISRGMIVASVEYGNTEALAMIIRHVSENETDYARFLGRGLDSVLSRLINNYEGTMPLHLAVHRERFEAVMQLVQAGADVDAQDFNKLTALQYCQAPGVIADYLLSRGATPTLPPSGTWLHYLGISAKDKKEMATRIFRQAPINSIYRPHPLKPTLHPKVLAALMDSGQDLNAKDDNDSSIMSVAMCSPGTASLVLNSSVDLEDTDLFPWSTMGEPIERSSYINYQWKHYVRRFGIGELRHVSNLQPTRGWSPLCLATCTDAIGVMDHCLEMGAEVDFEGSPFGSALMAATAMNRIESVKFLVRHNASIFYVGKQGFTTAVIAGDTSQRVIDWLLVKRFQDQGKLEAPSHSSTAVDDSSNPRPRLSWCPIRIELRLNADFERQPPESLLAYLRRLAVIKKKMGGRIVPVPKPKFIAKSKVSVVYEI